MSFRRETGNFLYENKSESVSSSVVSDSFETPWAIHVRLLCPWDSPGKNTRSGLPFPSPGDLPDSVFEPGSLALQADSLPSEPPRKPGKFSA